MPQFRILTSNDLKQQLGTSTTEPMSQAAVKAAIEAIPAGESSIHPVIETITRPARLDVNFIFEGNSRTSTYRFHPEGTVGFENQFPAYPEQLMELPNFKNRGNFYNVAVWGTTNSTVFGRYNTNIKPHRPAANGGEAGITQAYIFIMTGILDVVPSPSNVDAQIAAYKAYCDTAKADGFKVVVLGEFFGYATYTDAGELARLKYNNAMMDYARTGGIYMYIDVDHLIGSNMTSIFRADTSFHLTTNGKKLIADYVNSRFNPGAENKSDAFIPYITIPDLFAKVDKVAGKGLSTNDYTATDKAQVNLIPNKLDKVPALNSTYGGGYVAAVSVEDAEVVVLLTQETSINDCMSEFWDDAVGYQYDGWVLPSQNQGFLLLNSGFALGDLIKFWTPSEDGVNALSLYHDSGNIDGSWMLKSTYARVLLVKQLTFKRYDYSSKVSGIAVGEGLAINNSNPKLPVITLTGTPGGGEPAIPKSTGLLSWTGTAWAWITNNFLSTTAKITTANVESAVDLKHSHTNKTILDAIQQALTSALKTSYDGAVAWISNYGAGLISHLTNTANPHSVTAAQVGTDLSGTPRPASDVYAWAKLPTKPSYTYNEVGAQPAGTYATGSGTANGTNTGDQDLSGLATKLISYVEKTASFTLTNADSDKWLNCNHATTPIVITVPTGLTDGKQFFVFQRGAAAVSVVAGSGMTALATKLTANAQYAAFQISIEGTNFKVIGETKA